MMEKEWDNTVLHGHYLNYGEKRYWIKLVRMFTDSQRDSTDWNT